MPLRSHFMRCARQNAVGRKKLFHQRITLPLSAEMLSEIDAARGRVPRVVFIRRLLGRALRQSQKPSARAKKRRGSMAAAKYHLGDRVALTASLFMVALCLGIVLVFLMFVPPPAHGVVAPMSVSEQWLATCSHSPRREECYLYATGFTHALYIWREL